MEGDVCRGVDCTGDGGGCDEDVGVGTHKGVEEVIMGITTVDLHKGVGLITSNTCTVALHFPTLLLTSTTLKIEKELFKLEQENVVGDADIDAMPQLSIELLLMSAGTNDASPDWFK